MESRILPDPVRTERLKSSELRESFLVQGLFERGEARLVYTSLDRMIVGSVVPTEEPIELIGCKELASQQFAQRREVGVINLGRPGSVYVNGEEFVLPLRGGVYIGRGAGQISFRSHDSLDPALFYLVSLPAHRTFPTMPIEAQEAEELELGSPQAANRRTIRKYIHRGGARSCQLVMGITSLDEGSVWNTMPTHTHPRRVEAYLYFDLAEEDVLFHYLGRPDQTRHLVVRNGQVALSPSWSIHSGCATKNYSFVWAMGGENQEFDDMDAVAMEDLK